MMTEDYATYDEVEESWNDPHSPLCTDVPPSAWQSYCEAALVTLDEVLNDYGKHENNLFEHYFGHVEVRDGQVPPTLDPEFSDEEWFAPDVEPDGTGCYWHIDVQEIS